MRKINFLFGIHCHQPVGNFEHVIEDAYQKSYLPFLQVMENHPRIKFAVHYSGILYDWFLANHPEYLALLNKLIKRHQVEVLTGGYYEPILPLIPDEDKLGQIEMETQFIKKHLHTHPRGLWLTERVWEPQLPRILSKAGVEFVTVDDYHFLSAGVSPDKLLGYFITEEQGETLKVFPISKNLRYLIPFRMPEETIKYLMSIADEEGGRAAILADDGEKFGVWPGTHRWVYEEKYLERLLSSIENNLEWINCLHFSEYLDQFPPLGRVYLPDASYFEMMQWSLPAPAGLKLENIMHELGQQNKVEQYSQFFKGGFFRNFLVKYPESNNMHKKMLYVSSKLQTLKKSDARSAEEKKLLQEAERELYQGQCNCAYWHGIFGGLYLSFLRDAIYHHLIKAENLVQQVTRGPSSYTEMVITDFDRDGQEEILLNNDQMNIYCAPQRGGSLFELDYKPKAVNLANVLSRRPELYHYKITGTAASSNSGSSGTFSIHEGAPKLKEKGLEGLLQYDAYWRGSLRDHFIPSETSLDNLKQTNYQELGDFVDSPYIFIPHRKPREVSLLLKRKGSVQGQPITVHKTLSLCAGQSIAHLEYEISSQSRKKVNLCFAPEFCFMVYDQTLKFTESFEPGNSLKLIDDGRGFSVSLDTEKNSEIARFPIYTISQSEDGVEKTFQGWAVFFMFKFALDPDQNWKNKITIKIES